MMRCSFPHALVGMYSPFKRTLLCVYPHVSTGVIKDGVDGTLTDPKALLDRLRDRCVCVCVSLCTHCTCSHCMCVSVSSATGMCVCLCAHNARHVCMHTLTLHVRVWCVCDVRVILCVVVCVGFPRTWRVVASTARSSLACPRCVCVCMPTCTRARVFVHPFTHTSPPPQNLLVS